MSEKTRKLLARARQESDRARKREPIHREIADKLLTTQKPAQFTTKDGETIQGFIRPLGGGEIARCFQAEDVELKELTASPDMTWAMLLVQNQVISKAFTAKDGRTFTPEELDFLIPLDSLSTGEVSQVAAAIFDLSGLSKREVQATTGPETKQALESFRQEQQSK
jgi:hypothetical protein